MLRYIGAFVYLASGAAGVDVSSGSLLSNYDGDVTITGTVTLAGISTITGSLTIESGGTLSHPRTSSKSQTVDLRITGGLWVKNGGRIHANEMSSYCGPSGCSKHSAGYGGSPCQCSGYEHSVYGDFRNPDDLGAYTSSTGHYGGGRIVVQTAWLKLDGSIESIGYYGSSGGTVNVKVAGGEVTGSGRIDVSVRTGASSYGGGGGRAAVTGYSKIDPNVIKNVVMHGNQAASGGTGTFFYKSFAKAFGSLLVRSHFTPGWITDASGAAGSLCSADTGNAQMQYSGTLTACAVPAERSATGCGSCVTPTFCEPGQFWNDDLVCEDCPAGAECNGSGKVICGPGSFGLGSDKQCETCPEHSWVSGTGQASIEACICEAGFFRVVEADDSVQCSPCPTGHKCVDQVKTGCGANNYQHEGRSDVCVKCPTSSSHNEPSATSIDACMCDAGLFLSLGMCKPCDKGHNCPGKNAIEECAASEYQPASGQSKCVPCPAGSSHSGTGKQFIDSCKCSDGNVLGSDGSCEPCPVGRECSSGESTVCAASEYAPTSGHADCKSCEHPQFGASVCFVQTYDCCADYVLEGKCIKECPIGTVGDATTKRCRACDGVTEFNAQAGGTECTPTKKCAAGQYVGAISTATSDLSCAACPSGQFADDEEHRHTSCEPVTGCGVGTHIKAKATLQSNTECDNCNVGFTFQDLEDQLQCKQVSVCKAGTFTSTAATESADTGCTACAEGQFQSEGGQPSCEPTQSCDAGTYIEAEPTLSSDRVCTACTQDKTYQPDAMQTECDALTECEASKYVSVAATLISDRSCGDCVLNESYSEKPNQAECSTVTPCPLGRRESSKPTLTSNRNCCPDFQAESGECLELCPKGTAPNANKICAECDGVNEYNSIEGADTCSKVSFCGAGQFVENNASSVSDLVCGSCSGRTFMDGENHRYAECKPYVVCEAGTREVATKSPNVQGILCLPCTPGVDFQDEEAQLECKPVTTCRVGSSIDDRATVARDQTCRNCTLGVTYQDSENVDGCEPISDEACDFSNGTIFEVAATLSADRVCQLHTVCASNEAVGEPGSNTTDTVCIGKSGTVKKSSAAAIVVPLLLILVLVGIGVFFWRKRNTDFDLGSGRDARSRKNAGNKRAGRTGRGGQRGTGGRKETTVVTVDNPAFDGDADGMFATYGNDAAYSVLPNNGDASENGGNYGGDASYDSVKYNSQAGGTYGTDNYEDAGSAVDGEYSVADPNARCPDCNSKMKICVCDVRRGTMDMKKAGKAKPTKGKGKRGGGGGSSGGDDDRIYRNEGYVDMPGDDDDVAGLRTDGCNRKRPNSESFCTNPLVPGMFYCAKHQCPESGCRRGKGSKEETCGACTSSGGRPVVNPIDRYNDYVAPPTDGIAAISNPGYEHKAPPGQEALPYMDTTDGTGELYLPTQEALPYMNTTNGTGELYLPPKGNGGGDDSDEMFLLPVAGFGAGDGDEEYEEPVASYSRGVEGDDADGDDADGMYLEPVSGGGEGGGATSYHAQDYNEDPDYEENYEPVQTMRRGQTLQQPQYSDDVYEDVNNGIDI